MVLPGYRQLTDPKLDPGFSADGDTLPSLVAGTPQQQAGVSPFGREVRPLTQFRRSGQHHHQYRGEFT